MVGGTNATGWPYAPPGSRRRLRRVAPAGLALALIGLQGWAMASYHDDWPFAANAMFAFPRQSSEPVYELLVLVNVGGAWRPLDPTVDLGLAHPEFFRRLFFSRYYGSTDAGFPQRSFSTDDPAGFEARLTSFCSAVHRSMADRGEDLLGLRLELVERRRRDRAWVAVGREAVGRCDPIDAPFVLEER